MIGEQEIEEGIAEVAERAARAGGRVAAAHFGKELRVDHCLPHDLKLEVDRMAEAEILGVIGSAFPGHAFLAEEGGEQANQAPYLWIVDPLDGTVNYYHGLPYFCSSVACYRTPTSGPAHGSPRALAETGTNLESLGTCLAGAVYMPLLDELFLARPAHPTVMNGRPVRATEAKALAEVLVATGYGSKEENLKAMQEVQGILCSRVRKLRGLGAAGYDLANVARGGLGAFYERGLKTWDIAAGARLVTGAGGRFFAREYARNEWEVLASGSALHDELRELLGLA